MTRETGIKDKHGAMIREGDLVSLAGNMTADNSLGLLPNGWTFDETDVYEVYWDERINNWSLDLDTTPDSPYNIKYMNHAVGLLHSGDVEIVPPTLGTYWKPAKYDDWPDIIGASATELPNDPDTPLVNGGPEGT